MAAENSPLLGTEEDGFVSEEQRNVYTYVAGEDNSRLQRAAQSLGLQQATRNPEWHAENRSRPLAWLTATDDMLNAARMHSVGMLGQDEYLDRGGAIHLVSLRKRPRQAGATVGATVGQQQQQQPQLQDLFAKPVAISKPSISLATTSEEEDEEEEVFVEDTVEGGSLTAAIFGIVKGMVGPAILYLPRGFEVSGWAFAIPALIISTMAYLYSADRLLQCWKVEHDRQVLLSKRMEEVQEFLFDQQEKQPGDDKPGYGSGGTKPKASQKFAPKLLTYPELGRRAFGRFSVLIEFGIATMQFGVCLTYLIFVPQNLFESMKSLFGVIVPKSHLLIAMLVLEIPLSWIRDIRKLTPTNVVATFLIAYGLLACLAISLDYQPDLIANARELPAWKDTWYLFVGTSVFIFEGSITLLVPLQEAVYKQEDKDKFPAVNRKVISVTVLFYIFFGMACWAAFQDNVRTALTTSLPPSVFATTVQFAYSIAVIFTFPLQAFPAFEVTLGGFTKVTPEQLRLQESSLLRSIFTKRNILATILIGLLGVLAVVTIDYLGNVVSLLGSLVGIPIALIYPPIMHNILVPGTSMANKIMNITVASFGVIAMLASSYTTIAAWDEGAEG